MSFGTTKPRSDYTGTGGTATYGFSFRIFAYTDLLVLVQDLNGVVTTLVYGVDFTVTGGLNNPNGGTITLTAGNLANGYHLTIRFYRTTQQGTDLRNQGGFFLEVHEDKFDEIVRMIQQNEDQLNRSVCLPGTETGTQGGIQLPAASLRALTFLGFDGSGNAIVGTPVNAIVSPAMVPVLSATPLSAARAAMGCGTGNGDALKAEIQKQTYVALTTAGAQPAFTVTTSTPAYPGAYTTNERMRVNFNASGTTGSNTLNRDGLGAKNLKQYDSFGAKQPAVIVANMLCDVEYDGTDYVVIDPLPQAAAALGIMLGINAGVINTPFR